MKRFFMSANYLKLINESKILKSIPKDKMKSFLSNGYCVVKNYKKGSIIHLEGELCDKLEIILSGKIVIDSMDAMGNLLAITDFFKDDILGGNLLFATNSYYPMTITTLSDSMILEIDKKLLLDLFDENRLFLTKFLRLISDNPSILSSKIKNNINKTIREKIIIYLIHQQNMQKTNKIKLNISKKKLAEKMGIQRTSLSRELKKMKDNGCIAYDKEYIQIIDLLK